MSFSIESERKKPFSTLEKDLFLNIIQKYDTILSCKQTNASSALQKKNTWEMIKEEFNKSSIVIQKASTKQLNKLWYNMKAKARESKTKENVRYLTGGGPSVIDMDPLDAKVIDIDKNILTNIEVDIDSDMNGTVSMIGDQNNNAWKKVPELVLEPKIDDKTPTRKIKEDRHTNKIDELKCKLLEEELEFKRKMHEEELRIKILEGKYKEKILQLEFEIKKKQIENMQK